MSALFRWLTDLLYPPKCMLCHRLLDSSDQFTCGRCEYDLPEYDQAPRTVQYFEKAAASFYYEGYIRDAILRYKFHGMQTYARQFAKWLAIIVVGELEGKYDMTSWVPCGRWRRWTRGFDQVELLAKALAEELEAPCVQTLKKIRNTPKQSRMPNAAARRANVLGAYQAVDPHRFCGKRILLVDDVLTTGATLSECGKVLRMAGSGDPVCAVIAVARRNT